MSLLDYPAPPSLPKNARLVHFGNNGRPVTAKVESRSGYLDRQQRSSERMIIQRARDSIERVIPFEEHLKNYFTLHMISEGTHG